MTKSLVSIEWLNDHLDDKDIIILDASFRTNDLNSNKGIQIKGARFFDLKNIFRDTESALPNTVPNPASFTANCQQLGINKTSKIIIYDTKGIYTSPRAWWLFKLMGHQQVAVLNGGLPAWIEQGFETESISNIDFKTGDFEAIFNTEKIKYIQEIIENAQHKTTQIIDARSEGRFNGTAPEPRAELKSGHIPNSKSLPYTSVIENGKFKSEEELTALFEQLQLDERSLSFTCGSGITACIIALAADQVLEHPKSVFDGSWTEWAIRHNLIVENL